MAIIVVILIIGLIGYLIYTKMTGNITVNEQKSVSAKSIRNIQIQTSSANVQLTSSKGNEIVATLNGNISKRIADQYTFELITKNDMLQINVEMRNNSLGVHLDEVGNIELEVSIPEQTYEQIQAKTTSGTVKANGIITTQFNAESSSGDQEFSNMKVTKEAELKTTSGDIQTENNQFETSKVTTTSGQILSKNVTGSLANLQTSSGKLKYEQEQLIPDVTLTSSSGDVDVQLTGSTDSLQLDFNGGSGIAEINVDGMLYQDKSEHSAKGIKGEGKYMMVVKTNSGDLKVN